MIREAIRYILNSAVNPNLNNVNVINNRSIKQKITNAKSFIINARKVGDLYTYIMSSIGTRGNLAEMRNEGLIAFEDIIDEFRTRFEYYLNDKFKIEEFVVGENYNSYDICYVAKHYNVQSGGINIVKNNDIPVAALLKVTLGEDGDYPNKWFDGKENQELKNFMKRYRGIFKETYEDNSTIINTPNLPLLVFINVTETVFKFNGVYNYVTHYTEENGSKWFHLINRTFNYNEIKTDKIFSDIVLENKVINSQNDTSEERRRRLENANPTPNKQSSIVTIYKVNGEPYLEVHHVIPLSQNGEDTLENAEALCPNCHREKHYGINYNI